MPRNSERPRPCSPYTEGCSYWQNSKRQNSSFPKTKCWENQGRYRFAKECESKPTSQKRRNNRHITARPHSAPSTPTFKVNQNLFVTNSELQVFTSKKSDDRSKRALTPKGDTVDRAGRTYLCPSGHFSAAGGKCEPCLAGTFSEAEVQNAVCALRDRFRIPWAKHHVRHVHLDFLIPKKGRDAKVCQKCPSGFACESELGAPKPCADGKYSPVGTTSCKACPTFFSPNSLQSSCKAKTSFYIATSSLSFAFFGLIGIMSGRIKKASKPITLNGSDSEIERDEIISFEGIHGYRINNDDLKTAVDRANSEHFGVI